MKKTTAKKTASKKTAKKGTRRVPPAASGKAVESNAAAPAMAAAPAYQTPEARQARIEQASTLAVALMRVQQTRKSGNRSKCWLLDDSLRTRLAEEHVLDGVSIEELSRRHAAALADPHKISLVGLQRWLEDIRSAYQVEYARSRMMAEETEINEVDQEAFRSGDLVALMGTTFARLAPMILAYARQVLSAGPSKEEMGNVLRFVEAISAAAKVQSDAKHKELQSLLLSIRAELHGGAKAKTQRDRTETIKHLGQVIDNYMMGRAA